LFFYEIFSIMVCLVSADKGWVLLFFFIVGDYEFIVAIYQNQCPNIFL
jgi:hypothetical protein